MLFCDDGEGRFCECAGVVTLLGGGFNGPCGMTVSLAGEVLVADSGSSNIIRVVSTTGSLFFHSFSSIDLLCS